MILLEKKEVGGERRQEGKEERQGGSSLMKLKSPWPHTFPIQGTSPKTATVTSLM